MRYTTATSGQNKQIYRNIGRLRGFKIVNGCSHYVLFKIEKSPFKIFFISAYGIEKKRKNIKKKKR